jgi:hypothetical protein
MLHPKPELPDDIPIDQVEFPTRIRNALNAAGLKTVGEVRESSDETLLSLPDLGQGWSGLSERRLGFPRATAFGRPSGGRRRKNDRPRGQPGALAADRGQQANGSPSEFKALAA